jgi:predicted ATPase
MEAIAVAWGFNPEGGTRNFRFGTRASQSVLHEYLRLVKGVKRPRLAFRDLRYVQRRPLS